jgi:hypothetical protein
MLAETAAALGGLFADAPPRALLRDALVLVHLAAMAAGLGMVIATDLWVLRRMAAPLGLRRIAGLVRTHRMIGRALGVLWASGLGLAALALSAPGAEASPKLLAKLAVVSGLTLTAGAMRWAVLPVLARRPGRALVELPLGGKCLLAACGGLSTAGWASALMLGAAGVLRDAGPQALAALVVGLHALAVLFAVAAARFVHDGRPPVRAPEGVPAE